MRVLRCPFGVAIRKYLISTCKARNSLCVVSNIDSITLTTCVACLFEVSSSNKSRCLFADVVLLIPALSAPPAHRKPPSPYDADNVQVRSCVYKPTEIALIAKGLTKVSV